MKGMKRILLIFMFGAMFLFVILAPVHATTDKSFTTVRLNKFGSVVIRVGQAIGFNISGLITPIFNKEKQIAAPNHEPTATWKAAFNEYFTPQSYRDDGNHVDWDADANPVFYTALYGAILKADAEHSNHPDPTDCYISTNPEKSADVPFAPLDFQKAREADAWLGTNPVNPDTNGVVDFNLPSKTIAGMNSGEDCKKHDDGFERNPLENNLRALSQFGTGTLIEGHEITDIFTIITKWVIDHWVEETIWKEEPKYNEVLLTMKKNLPWYHIKTHDGGGPEDEAGEYSGNSAISGGWTAFTLREEDKKPVVPASLQPYEIKILEFPQKPLEASYDLMNIAQVRMQQAACYVTPYTPKNNPQADAALGGIIKIQDECQVKLPIACEEKWFTELKVDRPPTNTGTSGDPGYEIPYRSASCTIDDAMLSTFIDTGKWWCSATACDYGKMEQNITSETLGQVKEMSKKYGWNALFVMALWIHESGLGSFNDASHHLGCLYGWPASGNTAVSMPEINNPDDGICSQMACLFSHPSNDPSGFAEFMCSYNTTAITNGSCPSGDAWTFAAEVHDIYAKLLACTNTPPGCGFSSDNTGRSFTCGN